MKPQNMNVVAPLVSTWPTAVAHRHLTTVAFDAARVRKAAGVTATAERTASLVPSRTSSPPV